jgi:hypothetical protein
MAFGIKREELMVWKEKVKKGEIAFLTHYWYDPRFPDIKSVTKVGCADLKRLIAWGKKHNIPAKYIDHRSDYPHFDLFGVRQVEILTNENMLEQLHRFKR